MELHALFDSPRHEADEREREMLTFYNPYFVTVLEGGSLLTQHQDIELVAILSSN